MQYKKQFCIIIYNRTVVNRIEKEIEVLNEGWYKHIKKTFPINSLLSVVYTVYALNNIINNKSNMEQSVSCIMNLNQTMPNRGN